MQETITKQLFSLSAVTQKIETVMYSVLNKKSPEISLHKPQLKPSWAFDSQLWYNFCLLNTAYKEIDNEVLLSKDPIDRELSFYSVRLKKRLIQSDRLNEALNFLNVKKTDNQYIFEVSNNSLESKIREGDFQCIISPESQPNLMNKKTYSVKQGTALEKKDYGIYCTLMKSLLEVSITAFNRERKLIALKFNLNKSIIEDLEDARIASFKTNSIIDPTVHDFFSKKLKSVLDTIGNPSNSNTTKTVANTIGIYEYKKPKGPISALSTFLWDPDSLKTEIISASSIENFTSKKSISLNVSQKEALNSSLSNSISLIWGPPGTGKSYVLSTIVPTCLHEKSGIKILICAGTYNAIDNIFLPVAKTVKKDFPKGTLLHRLCSSLRGTEPAICKELTIETNSIDGKEKLTQLKSSLRDNSISETVGATPEQIYKLLSINGKPMEELFDVIIIDEASQIDVSHAILAISSIKKSGKLIISGDPLQLSPIHSAIPPEKIKNMVGSIFSYYQNRHKIKPTMLLTNYRSNKDIVSLTQKAGYKSSLKSYQPNLSIKLKPLTNNNKAEDYNSTLKLDQASIETILDPQKKVCCFIYSDGKSKQQNKFETALISILTNHLNRNLNYPGDTEETFWTKRIGIVTPYRAQQASIINNLITLSHAKKTSSLIRMAVDTVERFQGQQRDIILASYSVGNPDYINSEENFILNLNRFNVMISRAKAKVFVLLTQELLNHLSSNLSILEESGYIKQFAFLFCNKSIPMKFSFQQKNFFGEFRYHNELV
jgi:hypothetical protein